MYVFVYVVVKFKQQLTRTHTRTKHKKKIYMCFKQVNKKILYANKLLTAHGRQSLSLRPAALLLVLVLLLLLYIQAKHNRAQQKQNEDCSYPVWQLASAGTLFKQQALPDYATNTFLFIESRTALQISAANYRLQAFKIVVKCQRL